MLLVSEFVNHNLEDIVTPIKVGQLQRLLEETKYDTTKSEYLIRGFTEGFDLEYQGPVNRQDTSANIPLRIGSKLELWEKIMKEVKEERYAGPFETIPFKSFIQ